MYGMILKDTQDDIVHDIEVDHFSSIPVGQFFKYRVPDAIFREDGLFLGGRCIDLLVDILLVV